LNSLGLVGLPASPNLKKHTDKMFKKRVGKYGENIAQRLLKRKGLKILERNFMTRFGEIDIICRDGDEIVFVEVRCKTNDDCIHPVDSVTYPKQERIKKAAQILCKKKDLEYAYIRFDVIGIILCTKHRNKRETTYIQNAF